MDYTDGQPVPPGYRVEERVRRGPIMAGAIMAGSTYVINLLAAGFGEGRDEGYEWFYVPVVGGWVWLAEHCDNRDGCTFLVLHNLTHTIGAVLIVYGLAAKRKLLVRNDISFMVAPTNVGSGTGVGLWARF